MKYISLFSKEQVKVDDEDYEELSKHTWYLVQGYARKYDKDGHGTYMHRELNKTPKGFVTDHINGNKLDNRKSNLRNATVSQNGANSVKRTGCASKYKGVSFHRPYNKWKARITINQKEVFLGYHEDEVDAAIAYIQAVTYYQGDFAKVDMSGF